MKRKIGKDGAVDDKQENKRKDQERPKGNKGKLAERLPATHCLHAELKKYLGYCFYKSALCMRAMVDHRFAPFGLVAPQFGMLIILQSKGSINQMELGQCMAMDKATMVRMIDVLERKKYVTRTPSTEDRRANQLQITTAGRKILLQLDAERIAAEEEFLAPLNAAERRNLANIINKLTSGVGAN